MFEISSSHKSASWKSTRISQLALSQSRFALPGSFDLPPDINSNFIGSAAWLLGSGFQVAEAPQNEVNLLENQETESFMRSLLRPTGPKIGRASRNQRGPRES